MTTGCGNHKISNDNLTIHNYKKLEVDDSKDEEEIWQALLGNCSKFKCSDEELENLVEQLETQYSYVAYYEGKDAAQFIEELHGMTTEELAKQQLMKREAVHLIAEKEGLILNDEEYQQAVKCAAEENGLKSPEDYESLFEEGELYQKFLEERVLNFLIEHIQ